MRKICLDMYILTLVMLFMLLLGGVFYHLYCMYSSSNSQEVMKDWRMEHLQEMQVHG